MSDVSFTWLGQDMGEVKRVVVSDNHVVTHVEGGEAKRMSRNDIRALESMLTELHRNGVPIIRDD
mgnify:CR=1 FL=1